MHQDGSNCEWMYQDKVFVVVVECAVNRADHTNARVILVVTVQR